MKKLPVVLLLFASVLLFSISYSHTRESDQAAVKKEIIKAPLGVPADLPFSTAVKFGNTVYLSGLIGTDLKTSELVSPDVGKQTKQCLETLGLILRQAGMDYSHVVSCTVYLTDLDDYGEVNKAYSSIFSQRPTCPDMRASRKISTRGQSRADFYSCKIKKRGCLNCLPKPGLFREILYRIFLDLLVIELPAYPRSGGNIDIAVL